MSKKNTERDLLNLIYSEGEYTIADSESPDFIVRHAGREVPFGVEVTEFFLSESNARLIKLPDYLNQIFNKKGYRHKDDIENLALAKMQIHDKDGNFKQEVEGLFQEAPKPEQFSGLIADLIRSKGNKSKKYSRELSHVNLIINDMENWLKLSEPKDFFKLFFSQKLSASLYDTPFRQIFYITEISNTRRVYFPLKTLLLLSNYYEYKQLVRDYPWPAKLVKKFEDDVSDSKQKTMYCFGQFLASRFEEVNFSSLEPEVFVGDASISLAPESMILRIFDDYPYPENVNLLETDEWRDLFCSKEFISKAKKIIRNYTFYSELLFDVHI